MSLLDQLRHKPVNKGQHQRCDMRAVYIGIRHDNNLMIPQLADIKVLMNTGSECGNHRLDFGVGKNLVQTGFFYVQNLAAQGKDRLRRTASRLLCRAARGIPLYNVNLAIFRIFIRAVCQLAGQGCIFQRSLSSRQIPRPSCRFPCTLRQNGLFYDRLCNGRVLLQEIRQLFAHHAVHSASRLGVSQLLLGLSFKLGILDLDTDDRSQTFTDIISGQVGLVIL